VTFFVSAFIQKKNLRLLRCDKLETVNRETLILRSIGMIVLMVHAEKQEA